MRFDRPLMSFVPLSEPEAAERCSQHKRGTRKTESARTGKLQLALATLWTQSAAADDIDDEEGDA